MRGAGGIGRRTGGPAGGQGVQEGGQRGVEGEVEFEDQLLCEEVDDRAAEGKG